MDENMQNYENKTIFSQLSEAMNLKIKEQNGDINEKYIPIEWFTEHEIIEKAVYDLLINGKEYLGQKEGKDFVQEYNTNVRRITGENSEKIPGFKVGKDKNGVSFLEFIGADKWSKIVVYDDSRENYLVGVSGNKVSSTKFAGKIQEILDIRFIKARENVETVIKEKYERGEISPKEYIELKEELFRGRDDANEYIVDKIKKMEEYYKYIVGRDEYKEILKEEDDRFKLNCSIAEETGNKRSGIRQKAAPERQSELIPKEVRMGCLQELLDKNNAEKGKKTRAISINDGIYMGFVYELENGKMIVLEGAEGDMLTKIKYLSDEEFNKIKQKIVEENNDRKVFEVVNDMDIIKESIKDVFSKTKGECAKEKTIQQTYHTDEATYKANMVFFVTGNAELYKDANLKSTSKSTLKVRRKEERDTMMGK